MASYAHAPLLALLCFCLAQPLSAETLRISSNPPGASVEINGVPKGTTPYTEDLPGGYFHRPLTAISKRLESPMVARISLDGYATKELQLTDGPKEWVSLKGRHSFQYWVLRDKQFHVDLDRLSDVFTGRIDVSNDTASENEATATPQTAPLVPLSAKDVISLAKPSVVLLRGVAKSGTGFFVTRTGVIATNAHVARGESTMVASLLDGRQLPARVIHTEERLDIAFVKVRGEEFPPLRMASVGQIQQGDTVIAVGNPGGGVPFSITQGVVSAIGKLHSAGPGTWIQTDAVVNPGNSGGPLLNLRGEVIGIVAERLATKGGGGLTFALSASDLLAVLGKFYRVPAEGTEMPTMADGGIAPDLNHEGTIEFASSQPADILIDGRFYGETPAIIHVTAGRHIIALQREGLIDWIRIVSVAARSHQTVRPPD